MHEIRTVVTDVSIAQMSVCHADRGFVWSEDSAGPKEHCVRCGPNFLMGRGRGMEEIFACCFVRGDNSI